MSQMPSGSSDSSTSGRVFQRVSAMFRERRQSLFNLDNNSHLSVRTMDTILPQYSVLDPASGSPSSDLSIAHLNGTSSPSDRSRAQHTYPSVLRYSSHNVEPLLQMGTHSNVAMHGVNTHSIPMKGDKPWATLHLYCPLNAHSSNRRSNRATFPQLHGGSSLEGFVELNLEKPQRLNEIKLSIKGKIVVGANSEESCAFISEDFMIWNRSLGDPRSSTTTYDNQNEHSFNGKLWAGLYNLPFSFTIPTEAKMNSSPLFDLLEHLTPFSLTGHSQIAPSSMSPPPLPVPQSNCNEEGTTPSAFNTALPPSFVENGVATMVRYEARLHINHGRFRPETRITTSITYVPTVSPPQLPPGLRDAYEAMSTARYGRPTGMIQCPVTDPESWFELPAFTLGGSVINTSKPIKAKCKLYVTRPLSYTRGTVIPCFLSILSDDSQFLDLLATPASPHVRLTRMLTHPSKDDPRPSFTESTQADLDISDAYVAHGFAGHGFIMPNTGYTTSVPKFTSLTHEVASAVWWKPPKDTEQHSSLRHMAGEIHLSTTLLPSSSCSFFGIQCVTPNLNAPRLNLQYFVEMLTFRDQFCSFETGTDEVLVSQVVEIASTFATEGPIPVPFTKPPQASVLPRCLQTVP